MGLAVASGRRARPTTKLSELVNFFPKQIAAWEAVLAHRFVLYGGARGPGKSRFLRWCAVLLLLYWAKFHGLRNVRVGLFTDTYPDLKDRQLSKIAIEFPLWLGEMKETADDGLCFFLRESFGAGVICLRNLDDPTKYKSAEFAAILVDELTELTFDQFEILRGSLRWPGCPSTKFVAATNPGGRGHEWVKRIWIDKDFTRTPNLAKLRAQFYFVAALPIDNPFLSQEYWDDLNSLSEPLRRAWVNGDWNVFVGQAFPAWNELFHTCEPFQIPDHWTKWRAVDWGSAAPFCTLWLARNPDTKQIAVYREVYQAGLTDRQQARTIKELTPEENAGLTYADPSMWAKKNLEDKVSSTADEYAAEGIALTKADNDQLAGKRKVERVLGKLPSGEPGLVVFRTCSNLIRTLPALALDEKRVEYVADGQEDHAYDALRYGLTREVASGVKKVPLPQRQPKIPAAIDRLI